MRFGVLLVLTMFAFSASADWRVASVHDGRQKRPAKNPPAGTAIKPGDPWPTDQKFRWLIGDLDIPEMIGKEASRGKIVGLQINCGDGGEVWVGDELQARYDNDHPALVILSEQAEPGAKVRVALQVYGKVQGGDSSTRQTGSSSTRSGLRACFSSRSIPV